MIKSNIKVIFSCNKNILWNTITDNSKYSWRSDISKIEILDEKHFTEYTKDGYPTHFTITAKENLTEYKFDFKNSRFEGKWIGIFRELPNGNIELDFTEEIYTNKLIINLIGKFYLKHQQKLYINDLKEVLDV